MKKIAALLTGRGNNTMRGKNTMDILGKPVLYYIANAAKKCKEINNFYCSSDDEEILSAAENIGYKRIQRPAEFGVPTALHIDSIKHALSVMEKEGNLPDIVVVMLANNVSAKSKWMSDCIQKLLNNSSLTAVVPVYQDNDHHPLRAKSIDKNGFLEMFEKNVDGFVSTNRQALSPCYFLVHNFWVMDVKIILSEREHGQPPWSFMGKNVLPYMVHNTVEIHDKADLLLAEQWIKENYED